MKAEKNKVVTFHYHLTDETGAKVDSSHDRAEPLTILFGHGQIIPGLEAAMDGHETGDKFMAQVLPAQGYGERREDFTQRVPKKYFHDADHLKPGDATVLSVQGGGHRQVVVLKVGSSVIDVDLNHPMAGKTLNFDIDILDVREASAEEIEHGHVHGPHGHHH